jgi:hypothetical protein
MAPPSFRDGSLLVNRPLGSVSVRLTRLVGRLFGVAMIGLSALVLLTGCRSDVLPAVFGLGSGGISAYAPGKLPVVMAHDGDRLLGQSGTEAGRCIYENGVGRRFRADCPPGYKP